MVHSQSVSLVQALTLAVLFPGESSSACPTQTVTNWRKYPLQVQLGEQWTCWGYLKEHLQAHGWQLIKAVPLVLCTSCSGCLKQRVPSLPAVVHSVNNPEAAGLSPESCEFPGLGQARASAVTDFPSLHIPPHQTHLNLWLWMALYQVAYVSTSVVLT